MPLLVAFQAQSLQILRYQSELKVLYLHFNNTTGHIPASIIPESFSQLKKLDFVNLYEGKIPDSISELLNLSKLQLWGNNFNSYLTQILVRMESEIGLMSQ